MADKSFGVKELNLLNASGTPTVTSPNNLNLNANTVAISTSATVGNNLTVTSTTTSANVNVTGIATVVNFNATGISTIAQPSNTNAHSAWLVTANGTSAYRFTGPGQDGSDDDPDVYLVRGQRYIFTNNSGGSHPFQIRVASGGAAYSTGVTNNGASSGNIIFNVQHDAPAQLFYQCTSHSGMVGNIYIVGGPQVISGVMTATTFVGALTGNITGNATGLSGTPNISCGTIAGSTGTFSGNVSVAQNILHTGDTDTKIEFLTDTICFDTAGGERLRILSSGNVGIGTVNAVALTHIYDSTDTSAVTEQFRISGGDRTADTFETGFRFFTQSPSANGNRHVRFISNGNTGLTIQPYETSTGNAAADRNIFLCPSGGRVHIGNTGLSATSASDDLTVGNLTGDHGITIHSATDSAGFICFGDTDTTGIDSRRGVIRYQQSDDSMRFAVNGNNEVMRIASDYKVMVGMTTTGTSTSNNNFELASTKMLKVGNMYMGYVIGTGNNSNGTLVLHKMGQNQGMQFSGMLTIHSYTGSAHLSGCIVVRYNTDAVTRELTLQKAQSGANFELVSGTISGESGTYFGIKKNGGGTGSFYINAFVAGNIESYGGIREISNSDWTTSTTHFTVT